MVNCGEERVWVQMNVVPRSTGNTNIILQYYNITITSLYPLHGFNFINRAPVVLLGLRFINREGEAGAVHGFAFSFFVGDYSQASADEVIISQLQAISQLF